MRTAFLMMQAFRHGRKKKLPQEYRLKQLIKCAFSSKDAKYLPSFIFFQSKALYPRSKDEIVVCMGEYSTP